MRRVSSLPRITSSAPTYLLDLILADLSVFGVDPSLDVLEVDRGLIVDVGNVNLLGDPTLHGQRVL
jgi:hypothetical protein